MELFSPEWYGALLSIILIDLVLAGDNAVVIALAARSLPKHLQRRAIIWGTFGAIMVRVAAAAVAVWLLKIPGLLAIGGMLLFWIAYSLIKDQSPQEHKAVAVSSFWGAMRTIIIADAVMGLDNILAISGAAKGDFLLVAIGLAISIPIVMGGSAIILKFIKKNPWIIWGGGALLGFTGASMLGHDQFLVSQLAGHLDEGAIAAADWALRAAACAIFFFLGWRFHRRQNPPAARQAPDKSRD